MPTQAQYSDVFNYIMGTAPVDQVTAFSNGQMTVDPKYNNIINIMDRQSGGDDPRTSQVIDIDYAKLPNHGMTKYGLVGSGAVPAQDPNTPTAPGTQNTLKDPKQVYYDPNYGWVTPASNKKVGIGEQVNNYMPYIMMALGTAGVGALASIPAGVLGAAGAAAKYAGNAEGPGDQFGRSALTGANQYGSYVPGYTQPAAAAATVAPASAATPTATPQGATPYSGFGATRMATPNGRPTMNVSQLLGMLRGGR